MAKWWLDGAGGRKTAARGALANDHVAKFQFQLPSIFFGSSQLFNANAMKDGRSLRLCAAGRRTGHDVAVQGRPWRRGWGRGGTHTQDEQATHYRAPDISFPWEQAILSFF